MRQSDLKYALNVRKRYANGQKPDIIRELNRNSNKLGVEGNLLGLAGPVPSLYVNLMQETFNVDKILLTEMEPRFWLQAKEDLESTNSIIPVTLFNKDVFKLKLKETGTKLDLIDLDFCHSPNAHMPGQILQMCKRLLNNNKPVEVRFTLATRGIGNNRKTCESILHLTESLLKQVKYNIIQSTGGIKISSTNKRTKGGSNMFLGSIILEKKK